MRTLFHGSRIEVKYPEIRVQKFHKDFFWGFYCTTMEEQAARWSIRFGGKGVVNVYSFDDGAELTVKRFPEISDEWLDFIAACRSGFPPQLRCGGRPHGGRHHFQLCPEFSGWGDQPHRLLGAGEVQAPHPSDQFSHRQGAGRPAVREELCCRWKSEMTARCFLPAP